jgi:hypothetical protein
MTGCVAQMLGQSLQTRWRGRERLVRPISSVGRVKRDGCRLCGAKLYRLDVSSRGPPTAKIPQVVARKGLRHPRRWRGQRSGHQLRPDPLTSPSRTLADSPATPPGYKSGRPPERAKPGPRGGGHERAKRSGRESRARPSSGRVASGPHGRDRPSRLHRFSATTSRPRRATRAASASATTGRSTNSRVAMKTARSTDRFRRGRLWVSL